MSSSNGWTWDPATGQYVAWSSPRGCWINSRNERVSPPQQTNAAPVSGGTSSRPTTTSSSSRAQPARASQGNVSRSPDAVSTLENSMGRMYVSEPGTSSRPAPPPSSSGASGSTGRMATPATAYGIGSTPQPYNATHKDPKTGIETRWEVSGSSQYTDPNDSSQRSLNVKRIRETGSQRDTRTGPSAHPEYRNGRVIEVLLVPPPVTSTDAVSRITPNEELPDRGLIRLRRFVIIRDTLEGGNSFEALAIKTYNSQGVAAAGVIKKHHAVIYTGHPPIIGPSEQPSRTTNGHLENGMLPQSIKVIPYDKQKALDPMARLDFGDRYVFDHGVPNIRSWGRVDENSLAPLFIQYGSVWSQIHNAAAGPGPMASHAMAHANTGSTTAQSVATSRTATQRRTDRSSRRQQRGQSSTTHNVPSIGTAPITDEQLQALLRAWRAYAVREGLHWPEQVLNQQQQHRLAVDPQARATYFNRVVQSWDESSEEE